MEHLTIAKIDGKQQEYHCCSSNMEDVDSKNFRFIGKGIIYSIDEVKQHFDKEFYFFIRLFELK